MAKNPKIKRAGIADAKIKHNNPELKGLEQEYMRKREAFLKRAKRANAAGMKGIDKFLRGGYLYRPTLTDVKKLSYNRKGGLDVYERDLRRRIQELQDWEDEGLASIQAQLRKRSEMNKRIAKTLRENGYDNITGASIKKLGELMDAMRNRYGRKLAGQGGSDPIVEFFDTLTANARRKSVNTLIDLWEKYRDNDYQPPDENMELFRS